MTTLNKISNSIPMTIVLALSIMSSLSQARNLQSLSPRAAPKYPPRAAPEHAPEYAPAETPVDLSPDGSTGYYDFLDDCSKDLSPVCGEELFGGVFANATVSNHCCIALVYLGQDCHDGLVETIIEIAVDGDEEKANQYREKSVQVWNECIFRNDGDAIPIPAPDLSKLTTDQQD